jgi:hypothetical protein
MENINNFTIENYIQNFRPSKINKELYGEVNTPFSLIKEMIYNIPDKYLKNPTLKWLDPAAGQGYYMMCLFSILMITLKEKIVDDIERKNHILQNMLFMVEYNIENYEYLLDFFGNNTNIINNDFLDVNYHFKFDIIIGNPPYNFQGLKKVPTNINREKKTDGFTIWGDFIKHSISLLKNKGLLTFIVPSLWMKPDKMKMYNYILQYKLINIKTYTNTETLKLFKGQAQTPTCYFLLEKSNSINTINLYNKYFKKYETYDFIFGKPIPLIGATIINKLMKYTNKYGNLKVIKTNMPSKNIQLSNIKNDDYPYSNITTTLLKKNNPVLKINYSNSKCKYYGNEKLVLAHKMYGFPYYDISGNYGISNRDNYVIILDINDDLERKTKYLKIKDFLSTKLILFIYETTRYRMKYLEKYAFEFIPDITKFIIDDNIYDFFGITQLEQNLINNYCTKNYGVFT